MLRNLNKIPTSCLHGDVWMWWNHQPVNLTGFCSKLFLIFYFIFCAAAWIPFLSPSPLPQGSILPQHPERQSWEFPTSTPAVTDSDLHVCMSAHAVHNFLLSPRTVELFRTIKTGVSFQCRHHRRIKRTWNGCSWFLF